ncbi:MAG: hypothetical protein O3B04_09735 [Chloroflexi bacterium]|nr:hypothetical protein [Chloroflexota bacterium]MDA1298258.1 hypothetical protein [Chloroflexota bacterium]
MDFPGDLTPAQRQEAFERLHSRAAELWGVERAAALEQSLREASVAIARLASVRFSRTEAPGFYLQEPPPGGAP